MTVIKFLNIECVVVSKINGYKGENHSKFIEYLGYDTDVYKMKKSRGKKTELIASTEHERIKNALNKGEGVIYLDKVYFKNENLAKNKSYTSYFNYLSINIKELHSYLNGEMYHAIKDTSHFSIVKGIIAMYRTEIINEEKLSTKLIEYIKEEYLDSIVKSIIRIYNTSIIIDDDSNSLFEIAV